MFTTIQVLYVDVRNSVFSRGRGPTVNVHLHEHDHARAHSQTRACARKYARANIYPSYTQVGIITRMCVSLYMCSHMAWMGKGEQKLSPPGAPLFPIICGPGGRGTPIGHAVPGAGDCMGLLHRSLVWPRARLMWFTR